MRVSRLPFNYVQFDVNNREHIEAYKMLLFENKQHPTLRFLLEPEFESLPSMLNHYIGKAFVAEKLAV